MASFEGGSIKPAMVERHVNACRHVLSQLTSSIGTLSCVTELVELLDLKLKNSLWAPNTCRTYVGSLMLFVKFLQKMRQMSRDAYTNFNVEALLILRESARNWCNSFSKLNNIKRQEKLRSMTENDIINPDDIKHYLNKSDNRIVLLKNVGEHTITSRSMHSKLRNYLMFNIAIANANRTGCLLNMTQLELNKAEIRMGQHVIQVHDHKTYSTHGPADLILKQDLYSFIQQYVQFVRPASNSSKVFVTWSGNAMTAGTVVHALSTELAYAGVAKRCVCYILHSNFYFRLCS